MAKLDNIKAVMKDTRSRVILIITVVIILIGVGLGYWGLKKETATIPASAKVTGGAPRIRSVAGVGKPSREYVKTQQLENLLQAQEAARTGGSSVPTVTRSGLIGSGELAPRGAATDEECSPEALRRARAAGVTAEELRCKGCEAEQLRAAGYTAGELLEAGFRAKDLMNAGFSTAELKEAGFSASELMRAGVAPQELLAAGFTPTALNAAGVSPETLAAAGVSQADLEASGITTSGKTMPKDCSPEALQKARENGISAGELRRMGCGAAALKAAGFTANELKNAGFSAKDLKDAGFNANELKNAGFTAGELKSAGFSAKDLKNAGYSAKDLRDAGYNAGDLMGAGFSANELKAAGFSEGDLVRAGFSPESVYGAQVAVAQIPPTTAVPSGTAAARAALPSLTTQEQTDLDTLERLQQQQQEQLSQAQREEFMNQLQEAMASQANELFSSWSPPPTQVFVEGAKESDTQTTEAKKAAASAAAQAATKPPVIKAGTIMFAVLDTGINSDEPSPIMASIVDGPFKGGKLLGDFTRVDKKVVLRFTTLSMPNYPNSITVNAVAIDPNKARTALATDVNSHYLLRYGTLFASSFLEGLGDAISESGSTTAFGEFPFPIVQTKNKLNTEETLMVALGEVGKGSGRELKKNINRAPTVKVRGGYGIGILFMADVSLGEVSPTAGQLKEQQAEVTGQRQETTQTQQGQSPTQKRFTLSELTQAVRASQ